MLSAAGGAKCCWSALLAADVSYAVVGYTCFLLSLQFNRGMNVLLYLQPDPAGGDWPSGTQQGTQQQQQQQQPGTGSYQGTAAAGQPGAAAGGQGHPFQQQQQWQQQQGKAQAPWDGWMGQQQQDDVVDVFYGRGAPKQQ
jgi:hypothetical protein